MTKIPENLQYVMLGGAKQDITAVGLNSIEEIVTAAKTYDPSLANADYEINGDTLSFVVRAGTKG